MDVDIIYVYNTIANRTTFTKALSQLMYKALTRPPYEFLRLGEPMTLKGVFAWLPFALPEAWPAEPLGCAASVATIDFFICQQYTKINK